MKILFPFLIALQFLTKIPIYLPNVPTPKENGFSILYYPLVGLIIGLVLYLIALYLPMGYLAKGAIITALWIWLTGGLHLDGLADTVDAFVGGYGDKERILTIMKDPHIGAMGVIAIVIVILLKFAFIVQLLNDGHLFTFIIAPLLGRLIILLLLLTTPYIRKNGLGSALSEHFPKKTTSIILIFSLSPVFILPIKIAVTICIGFFIVGFYLNYWFKQRIGGITGDTLGASVEMMEVITLGLVLII